jgi:hypothetical protein
MKIFRLVDATIPNHALAMILQVVDVTVSDCICICTYDEMLIIDQEQQTSK